MRLRTTKTSSGSTAVQVVEYVKRKMIVLTHIGSAKNEEELNGLKESALQWIKRNDKQLSLFPLEQKKQNSSSLISLDKCDYLGFKYQILYNSLKNLINLFKFHLLPDSDILNDLVIARIASPGSKVHLLEFLDDFFSITHHRSRLYRYLPKYVQLKDEVEARVIRIAKRSFNFNFNIVFPQFSWLR